MTGHLITAPLHEETRGKIRTRTRFVQRIRHMAWREGDDEDEMNTRRGYGDSEAEAIADLLEKERT